MGPNIHNFTQGLLLATALWEANGSCRSCNVPVVVVAKLKEQTANIITFHEYISFQIPKKFVNLVGAVFHQG